MKKLILISLLFVGCRLSDGDIVASISIKDNNEAHYTIKNGAHFYAPVGLYNIGDSVHFSKHKQ